MMEKMIEAGITFTVMMFCICGCGSGEPAEIMAQESGTGIAETVMQESGTGVAEAVTEENGSKEADPRTEQREIAYEGLVMCEYVKLAEDLNELVSAADMILKIKVEEVTVFVNDNGMLQTEITPFVEEVYKGTYHDEKLYVNGGEMLYDEFIQNEIIKKQVSGHEGPDDMEQYGGKYVRQWVDNQYIFHCGEEYIFFAEKRSDRDQYFSLYGYQGTFLLSGGMMENSALKETDLLKRDMDIIFNGSFGENGAVPEREFIEKIMGCR
ncbi:MAG: hypothetical protein NC086_07070 [Alistipes sp.]|nr:hypothetical protein [Alistipes sp.]